MSLRAAELIRCHRLLISGFLSCLHLDLVPSKGTKVLDHEQVGLRRAPCGPSCDCDMVPSVVHVLYQLCVHQQSTTRRHLHAFYWRISGVYFPFRVVLHPRIKVLAETVFFFSRTVPTFVTAHTFRGSAHLEILGFPMGGAY